MIEVPLNSIVHGFQNKTNYFQQDKLGHLTNNAGKVVRSHVARIDLTKVFEGVNQSSFALQLVLEDHDNWKGDYVFEGISAVNVSPEDKFSVMPFVPEQQDKDKIIETGLLLDKKIEHFRLFRIASLKWKGQAGEQTRYLTLVGNPPLGLGVCAKPK